MKVFVAFKFKIALKRRMPLPFSCLGGMLFRKMNAYEEFYCCPKKLMVEKQKYKLKVRLFWFGWTRTIYPTKNTVFQYAGIVFMMQYIPK